MFQPSGKLPGRQADPQLRDRVVLVVLAFITAYLLLDSLFHLYSNASGLQVDAFLHTRSGASLRLLLFVGQLACGIYVWHRFRVESRLRYERDEAVRDRADEMAKFQDILESLPSRISIQGPDFKVLYQNPAHRAVIGDRAGAYCYEAYCRESGICRECPLEKTFRDGGVHLLEKSNRIDGELRHLELVSAPLKKADGTIVAGIEVVQDTTERVRFERHITTLSQQLAESNRELRAFGSALAHDLRQPLTRTYMAAQVIEERCGKDEQTRSLMRLVTSGCEQMEEMVEGMLALSRIDQDELTLETVDLVPLVDEILLDLRALAPDRRFSLECPERLPVYGDRKLLRILLQNLLGNAWKYTREREIAQIALAYQELPGSRQISVRDNGIGFAMHDAHDLFRPFNRLHKDLDYPGTGIGLATARRVVNRHGGRIWAESRPGQGACFSFTLPDENALRSL